MNIKTKKIKSCEYAILQQDESGNTVMFRIPQAALYYGKACVNLRAQDKVDDTMDELYDEVF